MKLATWNVNSVRAREARLCAWLARHQPDVLCLQELKGSADVFPHAAVAALGYSAVLAAQRTYNGVAILSRTPAAAVALGLDDGVDDPQARLVAATVAGVRILSVYVPNGGEVGSDKWAYKLDWLARLSRYLERHARADEPLVVCGDFNIAPEDRDVAVPERWRGSVLCHDDARARLRSLCAWGLVDLLRRVRAEAGIYSWWDYRNLALARDDGLRIDLVLGTEGIRCRDAAVDRDERKGEKPSDHAPVVVELEVS
ncbi:MAG: exodeoxyribonuclease III [Deltaproteobacteria bacterium]|nr:exodeoxyribonuclease III [Deltaproteobacteria bacterium]